MLSFALTIYTVFYTLQVDGFQPLFTHRCSQQRWRSGMSKTADMEDPSSPHLSVVVIGGGWAGFSAADAVSSSPAVKSVKLLDASPRGPGGLAAGWTTPKLQLPVEAGIHGFWREYRNTFKAIEQIGLDLDDVLTPYTPSVLVSKKGRVAVAPVVGDADSGKTVKTNSNAPFEPITASLLNQVAPLLPPPLDIALLAEYDEDSSLTPLDRLSGLGLLGPWADFQQEDRDSWLRYDKISADNLFRRIAGVSQNMYDQLVSPLLHVLPMTPGYDCSAAAALSCFHVFALQSKGAFDVRWCRGTITEKIFDPWTAKLQSQGKVQLSGSSRVSSVDVDQNGSYIVSVDGQGQIKCDAIVFAVGATAAGRLATASPPLMKVPNLQSQWTSFRGITCVAVRLFFKKSDSFDISSAMPDSPVFVCGPSVGNVNELVETGFCIYDLGRLQDSFRDNDSISALEIDFFRADDIANSSDGEVVDIAIAAVSAALGGVSLKKATVVDSSIVRARNAVSHFSVGSAALSPPVKLAKGLYSCGDWVDRTGHASWSTEKAVVTGRQAAAAFASDFGTTCEADVIPVVADTPQLSALRQISSKIRQVTPPSAIPNSPWSLASMLRLR